MALKPIEHSDLAQGLRVYYRYSLSGGEAYGPFKVKLRSRDHDGEYVLLEGEFSEPKRDTRVSLADDEDYGQPIFYVPINP